MHRWIVFAFLTGAMLMACTIENGIPEEPESDFPYIEFDLIADGLSTRTVTGNGNTTPTTDPFTEPEKVMNTVDIFFYALSDGEDATAKHYYHIDDTKHQTTHKIKLSESLRSNLFGTDNKCKVYTVVNVPDEDFAAASVTKSSATIKQLKSLKASTPTFAKDFNGFAMFTKAENGDEVTYSETDRKASGTLRLKNLAVKIDLFVHFADPNEVKGVDPTDPKLVEKSWTVWQPATAEGKNGTVEVYIVNGVTVVPLVGWTSEDYEENKVSGYLCSDDYYDLRSDDGKYARPLKASGLTDYPYIIDGSLYSYPNQWTTDMLEQHQTYLLMKVNWLPDDFEGDEPVTTDLLESYYKIPINLSGDSENKLLSNRYYRVKVNINTLGGMNFGAPLELDDCSWEVLPWGSTQLDADIHDIRWLTADNNQRDAYDYDDKEEYAAVMYNTTSVTIPYQTTHDVYLYSVEIKYWNFTPTGEGFTPELVSILAYKADGKKQPDERTYDNTYKNGGIDPSIFTLTDDKIQWFNDQGEDVNGVYIDVGNQRLTFYHSVYPLRGDDSANMPMGEGAGVIKRGIYRQVGDKTYSPFYITLRLAHLDTKESDNIYISEPIRIKQYPGIYVTFTENTGRTYNTNGQYVPIGFRVSDGSSSGSASRYGVYVNGGATGTWPSSSTNRWSANNPSNCLQLGGIGGNEIPKNRNMYSIHVVQLSEDDNLRLNFYDARNRNGVEEVKFHIGDPRTKFYNNNLSGSVDLVDEPRYVNDRWRATSFKTGSSGFMKDPATRKEGGAQRLYPAHPECDQENTLNYYYPTSEGQSEDQAFMIAPVFRLASGSTELFMDDQNILNTRDMDDITRENARRRCASLQDNGYPAGRWRVPTVGEIYFFKMLYQKGVLPSLFNNERAYWSAQYLAKFQFTDNGAFRDIRPYPNDDLPGHRFVRCVYDDWYWVKEDNKTPDIILNNTDKLEFLGPQLNPSYSGTSYSTDGDWREMFVWGDKEKNNPQEQPNN